MHYSCDKDLLLNGIVPTPISGVNVTSCDINQRHK